MPQRFSFVAVVNLLLCLSFLPVVADEAPASEAPSCALNLEYFALLETLSQGVAGKAEGKDTAGCPETLSLECVCPRHADGAPSAVTVCTDPPPESKPESRPRRSLPEGGARDTDDRFERQPPQR